MKRKKIIPRYKWVCPECNSYPKFDDNDQIIKHSDNLSVVCDNFYCNTPFHYCLDKCEFSSTFPLLCRCSKLLSYDD